MRTFICLAVLLTAPFLRADPLKLWDGKSRGMDLVAIGYKRVTVYLADGRTTVVGIPILVQKPKAAAQASTVLTSQSPSSWTNSWPIVSQNRKAAINHRDNHAPQKP